MKYKKGNNINYQCSKRGNLREGSIKYNYQDKKWYIINKCNDNAIHDTYTFETFNKIIKRENKFIDENREQYLIDVTYKIIPKNSQNNKLLIISCFDKSKN